MKMFYCPAWQPMHSLFHRDIADDLAQWLGDSGSFMQRLRRHGIINPQIEVLSQRWELPWLDERQRLNLDMRSVALVRQVLIRSEQTIWMLARTVFPRAMLTGKERQLAGLHTRSLGSVLFKDPRMVRSPFELARVQTASEWRHRVRLYTPKTQDLWVRRSVFELQNKSLLLSEVIFPEALKKIRPQS
jgi:chorismate--pyruvate lyase